MVATIDGALFQRMIVHGAASINAQKESINELNVFPVPDGDTGTNMSLTIGTAAAELRKSEQVALDQVAVSGLGRNDRHASQYLFLLGVNDHVLPSPAAPGGILSAGDRELLALRGIELAPSGMDQMALELQNLYAALAQPDRGLTVSYPAADTSGNPLRPAFAVDRLRALFPSLET